ncbi:MAG TPA: helix-hairpin-helix domain-containing protein [Thermoanaerobaculia bacterium]
MEEPFLPGTGPDLEINRTVAGELDELARLLEEQGANPFRVRAYRRAAETLRHLPRSVADILTEEGVEGLEALPTIGEQLARQIRLIVKTGRLPMLERLRGEADPVALLATVPGVGPILAERLHHDFDVHTLEDLEVAAHGGRLRQVPGFGEKRVAGVIDTLASRLGRARRRPVEPPGPRGPTVEELLDVDREYRERAAGGGLPTIAPRRFNPRGRAWLPILHATRGERHYTALFSNTAQAHRLGRTRDWVVIYWDGDDGRDGLCTVVTDRGRGPLQGLRVVRGREPECLERYGRAG